MFFCLFFSQLEFTEKVKEKDALESARYSAGLSWLNMYRNQGITVMLGKFPLKVHAKSCQGIQA